MRYFTFDNFNTWYDWQLTLTAKDVTPPEPKTNYVSLDGMNGTLDLSESLTGEVAYQDRTITAEFWTSEGTFIDRVALMRDITAALHGKKIKIVEPDDPEHYFLGRIKIKSSNYSQVHANFSIEATCEPWRYAIQETKRMIEVDTDSEVVAVIRNNGVKTLCPAITVEGTVTLTYKDASIELTNGSYTIPDIKLYQGANAVGLSGSGSVTFTYREAEL